MRFFRRTSSNKIEERVKNGMALLDKNAPGWHTQVNTDRLDIASSNNCALGQTYGHYSEGRYRLGIGRNESVNSGFNATMAMPWTTVDAEYEALTAEWRRQIEARQTEEKVEWRQRVLARR